MLWVVWCCCSVLFFVIAVVEESERGRGCIPHHPHSFCWEEGRWSLSRWRRRWRDDPCRWVARWWTWESFSPDGCRPSCFHSYLQQPQYLQEPCCGVCCVVVCWVCTQDGYLTSSGKEAAFKVTITSNSFRLSKGTSSYSQHTDRVTHGEGGIGAPLYFLFYFD